MHLISPYTFNGVSYCSNNGRATFTIGRAWRTESTFPAISGQQNDASLTGSETDERWRLCAGDLNNGNRYGQVTFGVACCSSVSWEFNYDKDSDGVMGTFYVYLNDEVYYGEADNLIYDNPEVEGATLTGTITMPNQCGNTISFYAMLPNSQNGTTFADVYITDVT